MGGDLPRPTARCRFCRRNERCTLENEGTWRRVPDRLQGAPIVGGLRRVERATVSIPIRRVRPPERRKSGVPAHPQSPNRKGSLTAAVFWPRGQRSGFLRLPDVVCSYVGAQSLESDAICYIWRWERRPGPDLPFRWGPRIPYPRRVSTASRFMDSLNTLGFGLLGHSGFMDRLIVSFSGQQRAVSIET